MVAATIKVQGLRVRPVRVPISEPHRTASGVVTESPLVLVDLITDQGFAGRSLVFTYTTLALGRTADLVRLVASGDRPASDAVDNGGWAMPSNEPGSGITWNEEAVARLGD